MIVQTVEHAAAVQAIACFTSLHSPNEPLTLSGDADDYTSNGTEIVANLRDLAMLIKAANCVVH